VVRRLRVVREVTRQRAREGIDDRCRRRDAIVSERDSARERNEERHGEDGECEPASKTSHVSTTPIVCPACAQLQSRQSTDADLTRSTWTPVSSVSDRGACVVSSPETVQTPTTLGERVRAARRELGMSQAQLAGEELTKGFISQIESGLVRPSVRSLQIIATRLGRPLDYFVGDEPLAATKRVRFHRLAAEAAVERRDWPVVRSEASAALASAVPARERGALLRLVALADLAAGD